MNVLSFGRMEFPFYIVSCLCKLMKTVLQISMIYLVEYQSKFPLRSSRTSSLKIFLEYRRTFAKDIKKFPKKGNELLAIAFC